MDDQVSQQHLSSAHCESATEIRRGALDLLARREHARAELQQKLQRRFRRSHISESLAANDIDALIETVIVTLTEEGLQSDERFAENFVHGKIRRGIGPRRISYELRQHGLEEEIVAGAMAAADVDWDELKTVVLSKRFGPQDAQALDQKARAKRMRFLQQRGF